ncbi:choline dehydrogenase [Flavisphingomonas formosensis]|uniref:choline dehydrogenase n=1 Tax=Flavisphingomonas formosensis TaxID=861534 RepID=UPI0012F7DF98|nr:choline dehydrogenase [Sphingomonas formosensis]
MNDISVDYIIVGAGSAGSVLANRLTANGRHRVLLLEAGGRNTSLLVSMPAGVGVLSASRNASNWGFESEAVPGFGGRPIFLARGKGLGGSSSINGMLYVRGNARDFDQWRQTGLAGWGYADVLPYFRKSEDCAAGADDWHGTGGELHVAFGTSRDPVYQAFIDAAIQAGQPFNPDFNGAEQEGFGRYQLNIKDGRRSGALSAFLKPAMARSNLSVETGAHVTAIGVENGRAVSVSFASEPGAPVRTVRAGREVILCAGALQSPHILQLSGIGDPERLKAAGIAPVHALSGVGLNMQDHVDVAITWSSTRPSLYSKTKGWRKPLIGLRYLLTRGGLGAENSLEAGGFARSREGLDRPDIQIQFVPGIMINHGQKGMLPIDGFSIDVVPLHPESRGEVDVSSADPFAPPVVRPNHLATPNDVRVLREAVHLARRIGEQPALAAFRVAELEPGRAVRSDDEIDAWARENASTIFHPVGTCKMGADGDPLAVVDAALRIRGLAGLRVVDASVMPTIVSGNTNAATFMIAEKAADMILADA